MTHERLAVIIGISLLLLASCSGTETAIPTPTPIVPTPTTIPEEYEIVDPRELYISFMAQLQRLEVDSADNVKDIEGTVTHLSVGDTDIALITDELLLEDERVILTTQDYGKFKLTCNSIAQCTFWLKPSQIERLKELQD